MSLFDIFRRKDPRANYGFDETDRKISAERRRLNAELENVKKAHAIAEERERHKLEMMRLRAEIDDLQDELFPEDDSKADDPEQALAMGLISRLFSGNSTTNPAAVAPTPVTAAAYSDDDLRAMWASVPQNVKTLAPSCTDEQVKEFIRKQMPQADSDTVERALRIIRAT